jgi:hypothetical protein
MDPVRSASVWRIRFQIRIQGLPIRSRIRIRIRINLTECKEKLYFIQQILIYCQKY